VSQSNTLSTRLRTLIDTVQQNERALQRFQQIEVRLISADDFASFLDALVCDLARAFELSVVTLWLDENAPHVGELLDAAPGHAPNERHLRGGRASQLGEDLPWPPRGRRAPWLGRCADLAAPLRAAFFEPEDEPQSVALLPIEGGEGVCGYLCMGSADPGRFAPGMATDLLQRFAIFVSAGLVNVAHRQRLRQEGVTDPLTGLPNRRYFDARLHEEVQRAARVAAPVACLFVDIDAFKSINDTYGHGVGDRALVAVGACIRRSVRLGETVARYGGEEFVALVQGDTLQARVVAERVRAAVEQLEVLDDAGEPLRLTASVGVAAWVMSPEGPPAAEAARALIDAADQAMYRAKRAGRNRVDWQAAAAAVGGED
jgi:diguanylate cyclase (GGDEF)-like protein